MFGSLFGQRLFGQLLTLTPSSGGHEHPSVPGEVVSEREWRYRLEVHLPKAMAPLPAGCLAEIPRFIEGRVQALVDEAATLTLTVNRAEGCVPYLRRPAIIKLFDPHDALIETFVIWSITETDETLTLTALGLESNLAREAIPERYHVEHSDGVTVREHVEALLAYQEIEPAIGVGVIDSSIRTLVRGLHVEKGASILHGLYELHKTVGGHIWVTPSGVVNWKWTRGRDIGQEFSTGHNMANLKINYDYSNLVTKLYYYGQAEGETHLNLTDAGQPHEYVLAPVSIRNEHGIITRVVTDTEVSDADVLLSRAQRYLEEHQEPLPVYEADVIDLSHDAAYNYDVVKSVGLGDVVTLFSERITGGHAQQNIVAVDRDLRHPERVQVTFGRLGDNLLELFREMQQQLNAPPDMGQGYAIIDGTLDGMAGLRHGMVVFDRSDNTFKGLLLDPPDGRWPGANASLVPLGSGGDGDSLTEIEVQNLITAALEELDIPQPGDDIRSVGSSNQPGADDGYYARHDHVHQGDGGGIPGGAVWLPWEEPDIPL